MMIIRQLFPEPVYSSKLDRAITKKELQTIAKYKKETNSNAGNITSSENYVLENDNSSNNILFGIFFKKRHIGNTRLTVKKNDAILGIAIFDRRSQGQGFGSKALKIISDFAIKKLNIRTVKGGIDKKNFASIETFKKAGFLIKPNINIYNKSSRKYCLAIMKK